jgi:hypothetical protein
MKIELPFDNAGEVTNWAIEWLREAGYRVLPPHHREPETPKEIAARLGLASSRHICRRMARGDWPPVKMRCGAKGRICEITTTPEFDAWLLDKRG